MCRGPEEVGGPRHCDGKCNDPVNRSAYQRATRARHRAEDSAAEHVSPPEPVGTPEKPESVSLTDLIADLASVVTPVETGTEVEQARAAMREAEAEERLLGTYGSLDQAAIAVGARIASRAEELAGITEEEIKKRYDASINQAETVVAATKAAGPTFVKLAETALSRIRHGLTEDTQKDLRRLADGYQAALAEHREFGGTLKLHGNSNSAAKKAFQEITELFPSDWVAASNQHRVMLASSTVKRAHYADTFYRKGSVQRVEFDVLTPEQESRINDPDPGGQWIKTDRMGSMGRRNPETGVWESRQFPVYERLQFEVIKSGDTFRAKKNGDPYGTGWEQWVHPADGTVYWRRPSERKSMGKDVVETVSQILVSDTRPRVADRSATFEAAAHEFSHRCESAVPGVAVLENEFLTRRTSIVVDPETGATDREKKVLLYAGTDEWTRPDHFASAYMGKHYDHGHTEILSMGMESLFAGTHGGLIGVNSHDADPEMRNFILGVLATAGRS